MSGIFISRRLAPAISNPTRRRFFLAVLTCLLLFPGCAASPGLPGVLVFVLTLAFFTACNGLVSEDRFHEALLRALLRDKSSSSNSVDAGCSATQDYTRSFDLSVVDPAAAGIGYKITGAGATLGQRISGAGDFNGDGIGDIVVSDHGISAQRGRVYVLYGRREGGDIDLSGFSAADGIAIDGENANDRIGRRTVSSAGDVNNDGYDDILIGTIDKGGLDGAFYLIFGGESPANVSLPPASPSIGVEIDGGFNYYAGHSSVGLGDINGDDIDDFAVGSIYGPAPYRGRTHVIYGKDGGFPSASLSLATVTGSEGFYIAGEDNTDYMGTTVAAPGDINGDGVRDILTGGYATSTDSDGYIIYGSTGTRADIDTSGGVGAQGFEISGSTNDWDLRSTAGGGDFNGDGEMDFVLASSEFNSNTGRIVLFYGDVGTLTLGTPTADQGFILDGVSNYNSGNSTAMADVNGDGLADLLVGAYLADYSVANSGSAYLVFGQDGIPNTGATLAGYTGGTTGVRFDGTTNNGRLGTSAALADVNGDNCIDILLGQPNAGNGYAFIIYGGKTE